MCKRINSLNILIFRRDAMLFKLIRVYGDILKFSAPCPSSDIIKIMKSPSLDHKKSVDVHLITQVRVALPPCILQIITCRNELMHSVTLMVQSARSKEIFDLLRLILDKYSEKFDKVNLRKMCGDAISKLNKVSLVLLRFSNELSSDSCSKHSFHHNKHDLFCFKISYTNVSISCSNNIERKCWYIITLYII